MIQLVNNILGVSRIETGRLSINITDADVSTLILAQIDEVEALAASKGIGINYIAKVNRQTIPVGTILFGQLVHNLLTNAIRYTIKENTAIDITLEETKKEYILSVRGQGIGIPAEAQSRIFNSFYRADNAV